MSRANISSKRQQERRRQPEPNRDNAQKAIALRAQQRLRRDEFIGRVRFRDAAGNRYAMPHRNDSLYRSYLSQHLIDPLRQRTGVNESDDERDTDTAAADDDDEDEDAQPSGRTLLYVSKPITRKLVAVHQPGSTVRLLDMKTKQVLTGRVRKFMFVRRDRSATLCSTAS